MAKQIEEDFGSGRNWHAWKKLLSFMKPQRRLMIGLGLIMAFVAIIDGFFPQLTRYALDVIVPQAKNAHGQVPGLVPFVIVYGSIAIVQGFNVFALIAIAGLVEVRICHDLRDRAFRRLQELSFSWYDKTPAGWIQSRMTSDTMRLGETIAWGLVDFVWGIFFILSIVVFMFAMNWKLALIALVILPPLIAACMWFQRKLLVAQRRSRKQNSYLTGLMSEGIQGARTAKTLGAEEDQIADFGSSSLKLRNYSMRAVKLSALFLPVVIMLTTTGAAIALGVGGSWVLQDWLSYGTLVAFVSYALQLFDPSREVARVLSDLQAAQASAERLISLIETEPEIQDSADVIAHYGDALNARHENWERISGEVVFENVDFSYDLTAPVLIPGEEDEDEAKPALDFAAEGGSSPQVFKGFNLTIPAGQTLAVVGETGSGKSTLVNLLCRFYEPTAGRILIDGKDYRERSQHWLHSRLGYVLQTPQLFAGTIGENIRYGNLEADDAAVVRAAERARAMQFITRLEKGLDTRVGEGGVLLSTGEKQLISIARALIADPSIMILDEATSSVDTETEAIIQEAVEEALSNRTAIIIAHRLSTIRNADRIIVLNRGVITEDGSHNELMQKKGGYWRLYTRQFLEEKWLAEAGN